MRNALTRATHELAADSLPPMVLDKHSLPVGLRSFEPAREGVLDNATMAEMSFPGNTAEWLRQRGRVTGYMREFSAPLGTTLEGEGTDLLAATVVHMFDDDRAVSRWMAEVFLRQVQENVGRTAGPGPELVAVEQLAVEGFHDEAVGIRALQRGPQGLFSSTVIDFRVGRLLGVAFVVTLGDTRHQALTESLARELERQMVRAVLGAT